MEKQQSAWLSRGTEVTKFRIFVVSSKKSSLRALGSLLELPELDEPDAEKAYPRMPSL